MDTDQNLLFGVLALQADLIDAGQLAEACSAWAARKVIPLAELLVERGWITPVDRQDVDKLVSRKISKNRGNVQLSLAQAADNVARDAIREVADAEIRASLNTLPPVSRLPLVEKPALVPGLDPNLETIVGQQSERSRYTLSQQYGKGGLGIVWLARDNELKREIALKEIRPEHALKTEVSQRFLIEAQVTGQLEHPNIVPVYEVGRRPEDNQLFYTMRLIRGQTLRDAISAYQGQGIVGTKGSLELRRLLGCFISICNALSYAHSRGVIHRDLKPENVILGAFGEVIVLDWGLAKIVGGPEESAIEEIQADDLDEIHKTRSRQLIGTVAYMSPEQAEGRLDLVDKKADIYGLGTILFELLTGRAPHQGRGLSELIAKIVTGPTPRAAEVQPQVDRQLDAICAKAMCKSRLDRYSSVAALAEDIVRWLADEPVSVYPESVLAKLGRWTRRHRAWTQAAALSLVLLTAVSCFSAVMINAARVESNHRRQQARLAVDAWQTAFGDLLKYHPGARQVSLILLQKSAKDYEDFANGPHGTREDKLEFGRTLNRLAECQQLFNQWELARDSSRRAIGAFEELLRTYRDDQLLQDLAKARGILGTSLAALSDHRNSELAYRAALDELDPAKNGQVQPGLKSAWLDLRLKLGIQLANTGEPDAAVIILKDIPEQFRQLDLKSHDLSLLQGQADSYHALGRILLKQERHQESLQTLQDAANVYNQLCEAVTTNPGYRDGRAACFLSLASALRPLGLDRDELDAYELTIRDYQELSAAYPDIPRMREHLAWAKLAIGQKLHELAANKTAYPHIADALKLFLELDGADQQPFALEIGAAEAMLGRVLRDLGDNDNSEDAFKSALKDFSGLLTSLPDDDEVLRRIATTHSHYGRLLHGQARHAESLSQYQSAVEILEKLRQRFPRDSTLSDALASVMSRLGELHHATNNPGEAKRDYLTAKTLRLTLDNTPAFLVKDALLLLKNGGDPQDLERAANSARRATETVPSNGLYLSVLGAVLLRQRHYDKSLETLRRATKLLNDSEASTLYYLTLATLHAGETDAARQIFEKAHEIHLNQAPADMELLNLKNECVRELPPLFCAAPPGTAVKDLHGNWVANSSPETTLLRKLTLASKDLMKNLAWHGVSRELVTH